MDSVVANSWTSGKYQLQIAPVPHECENKIYHISYRMNEIMEVIKGLPLCEVRQLPDWDTRIHLMVDKDAQKLIQIFHRNGYRPGTQNTQKCPLSGGKVRSRFTSMIGENNLFCAYSGETERYRKEIGSYFSKVTLEHMEHSWRMIAEKWVEFHTEKGEINLFEAVLHLVGSCLFVGILGFEEVTTEDVDFNCKFWQSLFAPMPYELPPLETMKQAGKPDFIGNILNKCANIVPIGQKLWTYKVDGTFIHALSDRVLYATWDKEGTLSNFLRESGFTKGEVQETIRGMLLAGQESTGYLLGYLLYEFAKNSELQQACSKDIKYADYSKVQAAYLECLRLHSIGGALREAGEDLILSYPHPKDETGQEQHYIRKGDLISCYTYAAGHNPKVWGETVEDFNPNRVDLDKVKAEVLPFGHRVHRCLGEKTAEKEIMTILTVILENATLSTTETIQDSLDTFTLRPLHDIKVKFEKRQ